MIATVAQIAPCQAWWQQRGQDKASGRWQLFWACSLLHIRLTVATCLVFSITIAQMLRWEAAQGVKGQLLLAIILPMYILIFNHSDRISVFSNTMTLTYVLSHFNDPASHIR